MSSKPLVHGSSMVTVHSHVISSHISSILWTGSSFLNYIINQLIRVLLFSCLRSSIAA